MSQTEDRKALTARFLDEWDEGLVTTLTTNAPVQDVNEKKAFVRFSVNFGSSFVTTLGNGGEREQIGRVTLQIFTPRGTGDKQSHVLVDQFIAIFADWRSDDGRLTSGRNSSIDTQLIDNPNDLWLQHKVTVPFQSFRSA